MLLLLVRSGHEVMGVLAHAFSGLHAKSSIDFPDVPALGALVEDCLSFVGASHLPQACVCVCVCVCVLCTCSCVRACIFICSLVSSSVCVSSVRLHGSTLRRNRSRSMEVGQGRRAGLKRRPAKWNTWPRYDCTLGIAPEPARARPRSCPPLIVPPR